VSVLWGCLAVHLRARDARETHGPSLAPNVAGSLLALRPLETPRSMFQRGERALQDDGPRPGRERGACPGRRLEACIAGQPLASSHFIQRNLQMQLSFSTTHCHEACHNVTLRDGRTATTQPSDATVIVIIRGARLHRTRARETVPAPPIALKPSGPQTAGPRKDASAGLGLWRQ
jgi:hypothetical protein